MRVTTYGFKVPELNDNGSVVADAIEDTIDQLDAHSHNGVNSVLLNLNAVVTQSQTISPSDWETVTAGVKYRKAMTMPVGVEFDKNPPRFFHATTGSELLLSAAKTGTGAFEVFTWDNTLSVRVVYR